MAKNRSIGVLYSVLIIKYWKIFTLLPQKAIPEQKSKSGGVNVYVGKDIFIISVP